MSVAGAGERVACAPRAPRATRRSAVALGERALGLGEALRQRAALLPLGRDVAHDRGNADHRAVGARQQSDRELDREPRAVRADRRDGERAPRVLGLAGGHDVPVAVPVALAQLLGNDQVERAPEHLGARPAEHGLGGRIPEADRALGVGDDDRVVGARDDRRLEPPAGELFEPAHARAPRPAATPGPSATRRRPRPTHAAATSVHTAPATQTQARAKARIAGRAAAWPTAKLIAAYMPSGKTVLQRRASKPARGARSSPATSTGSHAIARSHSTSATVRSGPARPPAAPVARSPASTSPAARAEIASAPPATHWSPRPRRTSARSKRDT